MPKISALPTGTYTASDTLAGVQGGVTKALSGVAPLASPALTGTPTAPTQSQSDDSTKLATTAYVRSAVAAILNGVSSAFDTLAEIATELALKATKATTLTAGTGLSGGGDLSANRSFALADTAVTPGSYTNVSVTVDQQGRITAISNGSTVNAGSIFGLTLSNNVGDATNDIDIAAGSATDSTNVALMSLSAMTKQLDANWAAGTNQGMRNSAAAITNTTYHIYLVSKAAGANPDIYAHASATVATVLTALQAETGGATYTLARRIGSIVRTGGAIKAFVQDGDLFAWVAPVSDIAAANPGTSAVTRTLTLPTGVRVRAHVDVVLSSQLGAAALISDLSIADTAPSGAIATTFVNTNASLEFGATSIEVLTNTSAQVRSRLSASDANSTINITTFGWTDTRGK